MNKIYSLGWCLWMAVAIFGMQNCTPREEVLAVNATSAVRLENDTLLFDTVFAEQLSVSKRIKLFNTSNNAIQITHIELAGRGNSPFSLIINGQNTNQLQELFLRGQDSLLIIATVNLNRNNAVLPFLVTDSIIVQSGRTTQKIYLVAWGQNAKYYRGDTLTTHTTWDSTTAHFIYQTVYVATNASLTIEKGAKIYSVKNAGIIVDGTLKVYGDTLQPVTFQGPRLDAFFRNVPGQWQGIWLRNIETSHYIRHATVKNAITGLRLGDTLAVSSIKNTTVHGCELSNMSSAGIKVDNANITAYNNVFTNAATHGFWAKGHTEVRLWNNTFMLTPTVFTRQGAAVAIEAGYTVAELINNCIWGDLSNELSISPSEAFTAQRNLLRTNQAAFLSDTNNIYNQNPRLGALFVPDSLSPVIGKAKILPYFLDDKNGKSRGSAWDIGAVQRKTME